MPKFDLADPTNARKIAVLILNGKKELGEVPLSCRSQVEVQVVRLKEEETLKAIEDKKKTKKGKKKDG